MASKRALYKPATLQDVGSQEQRFVVFVVNGHFEGPLSQLSRCVGTRMMMY